MDGYLICRRCNGVYKLLDEESPEDFDCCQCGGQLKYIKSFQKIDQYLKCPYCGISTPVYGNFCMECGKSLNVNSEDNLTKQDNPLKSDYFEIKNGVYFVNFNATKLKNEKRGKSKYLYQNKTLFAEELAIKYYEECGYKAAWTENYYWSFLMALIFWDEIIDRYNVITRMYNNSPIFIQPEFYQKKKNLVNKKMERLRESNLEVIISKSYKRNRGKKCKPIEEWKRYNLNELLVPVRLMDKNTFLGILERLVLNWYKYRSGLPDLIVFNNKELFFSEVKSEKDQVSDNQKAWHRFLVEKFKLKVDLFLINNSERKTKNIKSSYMFLNQEFKPRGDINDFKADLVILKRFIGDLSKFLNHRKINLNKDENINRQINSEIREIKKEIKSKKKELNKNLKVLNSDIIIITHSRDHNTPYNLKYNIQTDKNLLKQFSDYYRKIS